MSRWVPVKGALPAAHTMLLICWVLAVPRRECCEYRLLRHTSTELSVTIGEGRSSASMILAGQGIVHIANANMVAIVLFIRLTSRSKTPTRHTPLDNRDLIVHDCPSWTKENRCSR